MRSKSTASAVLAMTAVALILAGADTTAGERTRRSRPITRPSFDPSAERVELFDGMEAGTLETKVIANGPEHGSVLITNTTDAPLTVDLPESFVAVQVLKQGGFGGGGFGGGGFGGQGGGGLGGGQGGGGQQNAGGGFGGGGGGLGGGGLGGGGGFGGGGQGGGGGFFSIPPEKTVKVPYTSVCLNHGKADPTPRSNYALVPVEQYTNDPILRELITMVGTGRLAPQAAQAAVWTRTDHMTWQQLAAKQRYGALGNAMPYFSARDLQGAQLIAATAEGRVRERENEDGNPVEPEVVPARIR